MFRGVILALLLASGTQAAYGISQNGGSNASTAENNAQPQNYRSPSGALAVNDPLQRSATALKTASNATPSARRIVSHGGSLKDVQELAGHASLATTQIYIESNRDAKRRAVCAI